MAALTTKRRKALPASKFAGPNRTYPVDTKARAVSAKARAKANYRRNRISRALYVRIVNKANRVIYKGRKIPSSAKP